MEHCCKVMKVCLEDPRFLIVYYPHTREYCIPRKDGNVLQGIIHCPWCGVKFSKDLREEWFDIFFNELNLKVSDKEKLLNTPGLPDEFKTDEWWKKRGCNECKNERERKTEALHHVWCIS